MNPTMSTDDLLTVLFGEQPHALAAPMATWLASSRRFSAFVTAFHTKIRKKLRSARDPESLRDLELELETAYLLLRERSLSLEYEPQPDGQARGPDFAVAFTTSTVFMVEVTRLRSDAPPAQGRRPMSRTPHTARAAPPAEERFTGALCGKLGQLLPRRGNLLLVGVEAPIPTPSDLHAAMLRVQQRAEDDDPALVRRYGFRDRGDFFRHYRRLSAVLVRGTPLRAGEPVVVWVNPQATHPLPSKVHTALTRSHTL